MINAKITSDRLLVNFNPKIPIVLETEASAEAVGGIFSHQMENGTRLALSAQ